jgi:hypothetical protein
MTVSLWIEREGKPIGEPVPVDFPPPYYGSDPMRAHCSDKQEYVALHRYAEAKLKLIEQALKLKAIEPEHTFEIVTQGETGPESREVVVGEF